MLVNSPALNMIYKNSYLVIFSLFILFLTSNTENLVYAVGPRWYSSNYNYWAYHHSSNYQILFRTESIGYPKATLTLSNSFSSSLQEMDNSFVTYLWLDSNDMAKFNVNRQYQCQLLINNKTISAYATKKDNYNIIVNNLNLSRYLLSYNNSRFHIFFPNQNIKLSFSAQGFKNSYDEMVLHHAERGAHNRSKDKKIFDNMAGIVSLLLILASLCIYIYSIVDSRSIKSKYYKESTTTNSNKEYHNCQDHNKTNHNKSYKHKQKDSVQNNNTHKNGNDNARTNTRNDYYSYSNKDSDTNEDNYRKREYDRNINNNVHDRVLEAFKFFDMEVNSPLIQIQKKRRFLLKAYHPDRYQNDPEGISYAEQQMKKLNYHFEILLKYYNNQNKK